ncbi:MAG: HAMP domain-containing sensor histidine kinase, partial [Myxococcota bacterium]
MSDPRTSPEATRTATASSLVSIAVLVFSIPAFATGVWTLGVTDLVFAALYFVPVVVSRPLGRPFLAGNLLCGFACVHVGLAVVATNGLNGLSVLSTLIVPVLATLVMRPAMGWLWLSVTIAMLAGIHAGSPETLLPFEELHATPRGWVAVAIVAITGTLVQATVTSFVVERSTAQRLLDATLQSLEERVTARTAELEIEVEQRRAAEVRAAQANQAKTAFLMNMSHELRTPLNAVQGYAELVSEELGAAGALDHLKRDLDQITAASAHLLGLIDNILEYARVEAGQLELDRSMVDAAALVRECGQLLRPVLHARSNRLAIDVHGDAPLWADAARTRQILINLITNANKLTEGTTVTLEVGTTEANTWIEVHDEGPGIDPELLPTIFERFTRGSDVRVSGTGLGLAIAH